MVTTKPDVDLLRVLEPFNSVSEPRLRELAALCVVERVAKGRDPFKAAGVARQLVYLVAGEMAMNHASGSASVLIGGSVAARRPLGRADLFQSAEARTDIELLRIDDELLDVAATWDEMVDAETPSDNGVELALNRSNWGIMSGIFSINNLKYGPFSQLPAANIDKLLTRFEKLQLGESDVVVREGEEGDYYYLIESGRCCVERMIGGVLMQLAELKSGDAFGEEALVSEAKRNATVTMKAAGTLLRLGKVDFLELLREPLLRRVSMDEARQRVAMGGQWLDVRYPSEFRYDKIPGAINIPLSEIRNAFGVLDDSREYIVYCHSENRSSAAAFLLAQHGYGAAGNGREAERSRRFRRIFMVLDWVLGCIINNHARQKFATYEQRK